MAQALPQAPAQLPAQLLILTKDQIKNQDNIFDARDYQARAFGLFIEAEKQNKLRPDGSWIYNDVYGQIWMRLFRNKSTGLVQFQRETAKDGTPGTFSTMYESSELKIVLDPLAGPENLSPMQLNALIRFMERSGSSDYMIYSDYPMVSPMVNPDPSWFEQVASTNFVQKNPSRRFASLASSADSAGSTNVLFALYVKADRYYMLTFTVGSKPEPFRIYEIMRAKRVQEYNELMKKLVITNGIPLELAELKNIPVFPMDSDVDFFATCQVCYTNGRNIIFLPCKHSETCSQCLQTQEKKECGICRKKVLQFVPLIPKTSESLGNLSGEANHTVAIVSEINPLISQLKSQLELVNTSFDVRNCPINLMHSVNKFINKHLGLDYNCDFNLGGSGSESGPASASASSHP